MRKVSLGVVGCLMAALVMVWAAPAIAEDAKDTMTMSKIDLNTATKEELQSLKGIGESYADRIIQYRQSNGPFQKPEDIMRVKGIGEKNYQAIKDRIVVKVE